MSTEVVGLKDEYLFNRMFDIEIKRTQRSNKSFILIHINISDLKNSRTTHLIKLLQKVFSSNFRDTDIRGWYKQKSIIGIIFTDLDSVGQDTREIIFGKTLAALNFHIDPDELRKLHITFHSYPKDLENSSHSGLFDVEFNQDLTKKYTASISSSRVRKLINLIGSFLALVK
jgi:5S rRNA maturation endonuclease (ribonuclease M5)